jgi:hypothetical protein
MENNINKNTPQQMIDLLSEVENSSNRTNCILQVLEIYNGENHADAHNKLLNELEKLNYCTILLLFDKLTFSLTHDTLELQIYLLAQIMKRTCWDGTSEMLETIYKEGENPINDPYLTGHIYEKFGMPESTEQNVIFEAKKYFSDDNCYIAKAALASVYGWMATSFFDSNAEEFLLCVKCIGDRSSDITIKKQVKEILDLQAQRTL